MTFDKMKLKPFMTYITDAEYGKLRKFAKTKRMTMAKVIREALLLRMAENTPYITGYNAGLKKAIEIMAENQAAQMRFPSGLSFAEILSQEFYKAMMQEFHHEVFERGS